MKRDFIVVVSRLFVWANSILFALLQMHQLKMSGKLFNQYVMIGQRWRYFNELAKILSVYKCLRSAHATGNFLYSCATFHFGFFSLNFFFRSYSTWVFYRVSPKITFNFRRRVKNCGWFLMCFRFDFFSLCHSNALLLLLTDWTIFFVVVVAVFFFLLTFENCFVCDFVFFYYLFGRCHSHIQRFVMSST